MDTIETRAQLVLELMEAAQNLERFEMVIVTERSAGVGCRGLTKRQIAEQVLSAFIRRSGRVAAWPGPLDRALIDDVRALARRLKAHR